MTKHFKPRPNRGIPGGTSGLPIVAVVGRPNVGKSTLFNRLARKKLAIVHDEPGVTRDRHYVDTSAFGRDYTLVDTGGFDPEDDDPMRAGIARHVKAAIAEADVIVFVTDATEPLTAADRAAVALLRRTSKPVLYAANKADSARVEADAYELYQHGVEKVYAVSALHGRGLAELEGDLVAAFGEPMPALEPSALTRVSLIGRPNAGKSSLMNRLLGDERMLVDDKPGTTRDAIDAVVAKGDQSYVFVDTAGIRRKGKVNKTEDVVESMSVLSSIRSIENSSVVVLLCDANDGVAEQDAKILGLADDRGRAMIIALNKCDLIDRDARKRAEALAREKISFAPFVPIVSISAKTGRGVGELFSTVGAVSEAYRKRVGTGELNRFFAEVLETRPPPTQGGKAPRLYYVTQADVAPPTFVILTSAPEAIHFSYRRYVVNQLRKKFGFEGVPVRVHYKARRRGRKRGEGEAATETDTPSVDVSE
ncbi:MAG: ribosome biogenesis GTPase Der [Myxococcales bacterium]|jgi:GTP-binding protein|nr:ribosome biogenesis GTPase Der [Myxococcales bacterium]MBL0197834.1 ribosome biogenesis GTPase Der [Myxococcales bacterium]HQY65046.1 ribosome biogenesis GTPase Der [Polyangiaceae bacterium]